MVHFVRFVGQEPLQSDQRSTASGRARTKSRFRAKFGRTGAPHTSWPIPRQGWRSWAESRSRPPQIRWRVKAARCRAKLRRCRPTSPKFCQSQAPSPTHIWGQIWARIRPYSARFRPNFGDSTNLGPILELDLPPSNFRAARSGTVTTLQWSMIRNEVHANPRNAVRSPPESGQRRSISAKFGRIRAGSGRNRQNIGQC